MFRVASNEHLLSQKKVSKDELQKVRTSSTSLFSSNPLQELWKRLQLHREHLAPGLSISFLVDRTVEYYREALKQQETSPMPHRTKRKHKSNEEGASVSVVDVDPPPCTVNSKLETRTRTRKTQEHPGSLALVDLDTPPASVAHPCTPPPKSTSQEACIQDLEEGEYASSEEMDETESLPEGLDRCDSPIYRPPSLSPTLQVEQVQPEEPDQSDLQRDDTVIPPPRVDLSHLERDPQLHLLPGYPLHCPPMVGDVDDYLPLFLEVSTLGTSFAQPQILQIAARLPGGRRLFVPLRPRKSTMAVSLLKKMGYVFSREQQSYSPSGFVHENSDRVLELFTPKDAITELLQWLNSSLKRTDKSGVLLVSLHRETILLLLCFLDHDDRERLLGLVRCWVALDTPLWEQLGLPEKKRRQLAFKNVASLLNFDNISPHSSSLEKDIRWECEITELTMSRLRQKGTVADHCFALTSNCMERVANFQSELICFDKLSSHLQGMKMEVNGEDVKDICSLFPRAKDGVASWQELYAATFCHLLVLARLTMSRLKSMAGGRQRYGPERLMQIMYEEVGRTWRPGPSMKRIINAAVGWLLLKLRKEEEGEGPSDSSTCEDSEGSMPDEMHRPVGNQKEDIDQRLLRICANEKDPNEQSKKGSMRELRALKSNVEMKRKRNVDEEKRKRHKSEPQPRKEVTEADLAQEMELSVEATKWIQVETSQGSCPESQDDMLRQLREEYKEYRQIRKCPPDQFPLHEYLFYHPALAKTVNTDSRHFVLAELCRHLATFGSLAALLNTLSNLQQTFEAEELHEKAGMKLKKEDFPSSGQLKKAKLVSLILDWAKQATNTLPFSSSVLELTMPDDKESKEDSLDGLRTHLFHSFLEQALQMEKRGHLQGFALDKVDLLALSSAVTSMVAAITEAGFSLTEAVKLHILGRLSNKLKRQLKHLRASMEGGLVRLLLYQLYNFVDSKVKTEGSLLRLPASPFHQKLLSEQVVRLLQDGCLVKRADIAGVKVAGGVSFHALETLLPCDDSTEKNESREDVKGEGDEFTVFGQVELLQPLVLPACSAKIFFACVSGLPRLKKKAKVKVFSASDNQNCFTPGQSTEVTDESLVQIKLENKQKTEVRLAQGTVVGRALLIDWSDKEALHICPSYCLHFIKQYFNTHGILGIADKGDQILFGADGHLINPVSLPKDQHTNFKIWGSVWSSGLQKFYTVDAIIYFLHQYPTSEDYSTYLRLALTYQKPIVRHLDVAVLLAFMKDEVLSFEQIDPNFTHEKDNQLALLLSKEATEDDVAEELALVNNKSLESSAKEFLAVGWQVPEQQARQEVKHVLKTLDQLHFPIHKLRERYLAVPNHKEHFKQIIKELIAEKMKQSGRERAEEMMDTCQKGLKEMPRPGTVAALAKLLTLAQLFGEHSEALEEVVRLGEAKGELHWTKDLDGSLRDLLQVLSEKKVSGTGDGVVVVHTAATDQFWSVVVTRGSSLLYLASKALGPEVDELTQLEREARAVVWAIELVRPLLRPNCSLSLPLSSPSLVAMFTPGSTCSKYWISHLEGLQCIVSNRGNIVNPASALTFGRDQRAAHVPLDRSTIVQEVAMHMLDTIKETAKTRSRMLKQLRKRQLKDLDNQSDSGDLGICNKEDDKVLSQDRFHPSDQESPEFPECPQEDFQPLFEPLYSRFLTSATCKEEAIRKAEKMITWLTVHGVTYPGLKEVLEKANDGEDLEQVVGSYFDKLGMGKIRGRQDLIATSVAHFRQVKETGVASHHVKLESGEADPIHRETASQESEIELIQLESSDEEMSN